MGTVYTFTVFIESAGTATRDEPNLFGSNYSLAGHMWWRAEKYSNGKWEGKVDAGYTGKGITEKDDHEYVGDPAYTSRTVQISESAYARLKALGTWEGAAAMGFGPDQYNPLIKAQVALSSDRLMPRASVGGYWIHCAQAQESGETDEATGIGRSDEVAGAADAVTASIACNRVGGWRTPRGVH